MTVNDRPEPVASFAMPMMPEGRMQKPGEVLPTFTWEPTAAQRQQARSNHGQTLERLRERGGVSWCELSAILECRRYVGIKYGVARALCEAMHPQQASAR